MRRPFSLAAAAAFLALSTGMAAAATGITEADLNMRRGPGTNYGVITAIPAGSPVEVLECSGNWCAVAWSGYQGYSSRSYLDIGAAAYGAVPPPVVAVPAYGPSYYGPGYYGPRYTPGERIIRRGVRTWRRELREERRDDRRDARRDWRQERREDRREARQDRRENRR